LARVLGAETAPGSEKPEGADFGAHAEPSRLPGGRLGGV
jgi:hypothetical protein